MSYSEQEDCTVSFWLTERKTFSIFFVTPEKVNEEMRERRDVDDTVCLKTVPYNLLMLIQEAHHSGLMP